jgi:hypothetical protein
VKRILIVLLSAAMLSGLVAVPATAKPVVCDKNAMKTILNLGYEVWDTPYERCTFRLFVPGGKYGQDPVWTEGEYFHGGTFFEVYPEDVAERGWSRADVKDYFAQIDQHLFWGKNSTPDGQLVELTLKRGPILWDSDGIGTIRQETYFDFPPQAPGLYEWRYTYDDAILYPPPKLTTGHILISALPTLATAG